MTQYWCTLINTEFKFKYENGFGENKQMKVAQLVFVTKYVYLPKIKLKNFITDKFHHKLHCYTDKKMSFQDQYYLLL